MYDRRDPTCIIDCEESSNFDSFCSEVLILICLRFVIYMLKCTLLFSFSYHPFAIVCNRAAFNDPKRIDDIVRRIKRSVQSGAARQLRDQKTSYCPDESFESPSDDPSNPDGTLLGPPSGWIVTNSASTPAVISWVRNVKGQCIRLVNMEKSELHRRLKSNGLRSKPSSGSGSGSTMAWTGQLRYGPPHLFRMGMGPALWRRRIRPGAN